MFTEGRVTTGNIKNGCACHAVYCNVPYCCFGKVGGNHFVSRRSFSCYLFVYNIFVLSWQLLLGCCCCFSCSNISGMQRQFQTVGWFGGGEVKFYMCASQLKYYSWQDKFQIPKIPKSTIGGEYFEMYL